ncbi:glycosyltransferase [Bacillus mycoides]|uniref:WecB/TagA/CpsF family glycosyltransferase n=1 Tax=Bacillus mycoides TaxID=1405 RepID=UPI001C00BC09|nr:WecB/TagA/CpsF family glycosyltransferase [Bacillus mycoides]QWH03511.1 glycosyltransferase [Bacillus mycoides]
MKKVRIFDCDVAALTMEETLMEVKGLIKEGVYTQHVVLNASKVVLMQEDDKLKNIIKGCNLINADGQSIVWASKFLGDRLPERVAGIDLMENIVSMAAKEGYRIYFFGAKQNVVENVVDIYKAKYPDIKIAGYRNGYFDVSQNEEIVEEISNSQADILFVAFSSPQKEFWLAQYGEKLSTPFVMGVGGSFDVVAGVTKRAPNWMQKLGLEWFYRFIQEPKRMWKRYLVGNSKFIKYVVEEKKDKNKKVRVN